MTRTPPPSFVSLLRGQQESLLRAARLLTGEWAAAEELVRRTLAWALTNWASSEEDALPGALLVRQELVSLYVKDMREQQPEDWPMNPQPHRGGPDDDPGSGVGSGWSDSLSAEADLGDTRSMSSLVAALEVLPFTDRTVVVSRYYLSLSAVEIGVVLEADAEDVDTTAVGVLAALRRATVQIGGEG